MLKRTLKKRRIQAFFSLLWNFTFTQNKSEKNKLTVAGEWNWTCNSCIINEHQKLLHIADGGSEDDDSGGGDFSTRLWLLSPSICTWISTDVCQRNLNILTLLMYGRNRTKKKQLINEVFLKRPFFFSFDETINNQIYSTCTLLYDKWKSCSQQKHSKF